eukprot:1159557-Pelagomonas_calceolata.AAC.21
MHCCCCCWSGGSGWDCLPLGGGACTPHHTKSGGEGSRLLLSTPECSSGEEGGGWGGLHHCSSSTAAAAAAAAAKGMVSWGRLCCHAWATHAVWVVPSVPGIDVAPSAIAAGGGGSAAPTAAFASSTAPAVHGALLARTGQLELRAFWWGRMEKYLTSREHDMSSCAYGPAGAACGFCSEAGSNEVSRTMETSRGWCGMAHAYVLVPAARISKSPRYLTPNDIVSPV